MPSLTRIEGKTYPVRKELRALGGTYDRPRGGEGAGVWYVPNERADEAKSLLEVGRARANAGRRGKA